MENKMNNGNGKRPKYLTEGLLVKDAITGKGPWVVVDATPDDCNRVKVYRGHESITTQLYSWAYAFALVPWSPKPPIDERFLRWADRHASMLALIVASFLSCVLAWGWSMV